MWRLTTLALIALLCCVPLFAQSTTVSGQVTDAGPQAWNNGTFSFVFVPNPQFPVGPYTWTGGTLNTTISGSLNATGGYSVSIPSNSSISPQGSKWTATFCPQASSPCFQVQNVAITGGTQTINATPPAIVINLATAFPPVLAYSTSEVTGAVVGSQFYLLGTGLQVCSAVSGNNCTTWTSSGGASPLSGINGGGIWQKMGTIIYADPTSATDQGTSQEASVICEASPQVLTVGESTVCGPPGTAPTANAVLKMWFTCGYSTGNICYAESRPSHPMVWFRRAGSPLITSHLHGRVFKNGSTYHGYWANNATTQIDHYTSSDGITWTLSQAAVVGLGTAGAWDSQFIGNNRVWIEGATWYMLYEAIKSGGQWSTGIATSTDGAGNVWTKNASVNPMCTGCGGPEKYKDPSGNYWVWTHSAPAGTSLPSDVSRWSLTGLTTTPTLTASPSGFVLPRTTLDEGWQSAATGQLADVSHVEVNGYTYAFYEGSYDGGTQSGYLHVKIAVANLPWASVVLTNEGVAPTARPFDSSLGISLGNPAIPPPPGAIFITNIGAGAGKALYPGMEIQYQSTSASADQGFFGYNMLQSPSGGIARTSTSLTAARNACTIGTANTNAGCFLGIMNLAGTEGFVYNAGIDGSGNVNNTETITLAGGTTPTLTGTGACATTTGKVGGSNAGSAQCTGTTGASTLTFTFTTSAAHGWTCTVQDETTRANLLQQTSHTTTTAVFTATSVTQNDVFVWNACTGF